MFIMHFQLGLQRCETKGAMKCIPNFHLQPLPEVRSFRLGVRFLCYGHEPTRVASRSVTKWHHEMPFFQKAATQKDRISIQVSSKKFFLSLNKRFSKTVQKYQQRSISMSKKASLHFEKLVTLASHELQISCRMAVGTKACLS